MSKYVKSDPEIPIDRNGYPALARWVATNPDYETFIFRRFDTMSARNILHLESQVAVLECQLLQLDEEACQSHDLETSRAIRNWEKFEERAKDKAHLEYQRMKLVNKISHKLKQYHEALLLQSQIAAMDKPRQRALSVLRSWLLGNEDEHHRIGSCKAVITGLAKTRLDQKQDLVTLRRPADKALLSRFLQEHWIFKTTLTTNQTEHIDEQHIVWTVAAVSTILAAVLLVGAILALHYNKRAGPRLGLIGGFTVLFALRVVLVTNARRAEIFAATAAYAAVLVVFVSGDLGTE